MRVLALIPARGGSKGLPRKNLLPLAGLPLIAHSIRVALESDATDVVVSTDDEEIAATARAYGAAVPFMRPASLAEDTTKTIDVVIHGLEAVESLRRVRYDAVLLLQPTSPLRQVEDVRAALRLYADERADSIISVFEWHSPHPFYMYWMNGNQPVPILAEAQGYHRRQDFPPVYVRNGAIYLTDRNILLNRQTFYGDRLRAVIMPASRSINIDQLDDLARAERMLNEG